MYNLIVRSGGFEPDQDLFTKDRIFEYTLPRLVERYAGDDGYRLDRLKKLPCLLLDEGRGDEVVKVCRITDADEDRRFVNFRYSLDNSVPPLTNSMLSDNMREFGIDDAFEFSRGHWAVKDIDLYRAILRVSQANRRGPQVFRIADHPRINDRQISVMMPFDAGFRPVYDSLREMAQANGLLVNRADDIWEDHAIIQDVVNLIDRSRVVICDLTGKNANVLYELGIAHTLGREVILITQSELDVPFDLRHIRHIRYLPNNEGRTALVRDVMARIEVIYGA